VIDPITALAGIQAAVALVKKVSKTVDDVSSLGPVLGKYFDAKSVATKAVVEAKKSKSSMSVALQIELQLDQAKRFEDELQLIFQASGRVDVWNKIKSRAAAMDVEAAHDARKEKAAKAKRDKEVDEIITIILLVVTVVVVFGATGWFVLEAIADCKGKCGFQQ
jgi:hypothetical protein